MEVVSIHCPRCGKRYTLKANNLSALKSRPFKCPACKYVAPFGTLLNPGQGGPTPPPISSRRPAVPENKTRVTVNPGEMRLNVESTGRSIAVTPGSHILGRASADSSATIKIAPDKYISRQHARLQVIRAAGGVDCLLTPMQSANDVFVNNVRLGEGETVRLKNGDRILLGMTQITVMI